MSGLYFPYRDDRLYAARERVIALGFTGLEIFYLENPDDDEPSSFIILWQDILYIEPLRFSTKKYVFM